MKRFFCNRYPHVLGIEVGECAVNMVELDLRGTVPVLKNYVTNDLPQIPAEDANFVVTRAAAIRRLIQLNGIAARHAFVSVGGSNYYLREAEFPRLTDRELAEAVRWELERYVPYAADAYYHDFFVLKGGAACGMRVLLAAAPKLYVDALTAIFAKASLRILAIEGESVALGRMVQAEAYGAVIDMGKQSSRMTFYRSGVPGISHSLSSGFAQFAAVREEDHASGNGGHGQLIKAFAEEVARTIESYTRQYPSALPRIYLCGGGVSCEELARLLKLPVVPIPDLQDCVLSPSLDVRSLQDRLPQAAIAMGLALRGVRR